jgi:outer membrane assembly lipoprotein YfiO
MLSQKQAPDVSTKGKKGSPKKNPLADKPFAQLKEGKEKALKQNDLATAVKYLDAMRLGCTDLEMAKDILLEMADIYYQLQEWTKAEKAYNEFILLYPGATRCAYAHYRAIECGWKLTLTPDRDQTKTEETLKLCQQFYATHPKSEYVDNVTRLATQCREKLLESDINIFNFYLKGNNLKAAQKRLDLITKEHLPDLPSAQPQVFEISFSLAQAQNNTQAALRAQLALGEQFPDHAITKRLVPDLPTVKTQLASLEQKVLAPIALPSKTETLVADANKFIKEIPLAQNNAKFAIPSVEDKERNDAITDQVKEVQRLEKQSRARA